jgi:hypothetical protein
VLSFISIEYSVPSYLISPLLMRLIFAPMYGISPMMADFRPRSVSFSPFYGMIRLRHASMLAVMSQKNS